jgi:magnesium-transporting ATPase (P-type)
MSKKNSTGEWVVIGLSVIIALIGSLSKSLNIIFFGVVGSFLVVFALSFIILHIIYWVITKVHPKSQNWGFISWVITLVGTPIIIIFILAFVAGMAGSSSTINQQTSQQLPLITPQPTPTISESNLANLVEKDN